MTDDPEQPVGPGNPPKEYRWRKGQPSPNPRGRPPKKKWYDVTVPLDKHAEMIVALGSKPTINRDGERVELRAQLLQKLLAIALDEKTPAKTRAEILFRYARIDREAIDILASKKEKRFHDAMDYKERWAPVFAQAERLGKPVPSRLPHPEDVILREDGNVVIVGPKLVGEQVVLEHNLLSRKYHLELWNKLLELPPSAERSKQLRYVRRVLSSINKKVPPRLVDTVPALPVDSSTS